MPRYQIVINQDFNRPVDEVFEQLADHNRLSQIFGIPVKRIRDGVDTPNGVGSTRRLGPWPVGVQETVTALTPSQSIDYRISRFGGPVRKHSGHIEFAPTDTGSRITWTIDFSALPVLGGLVSKALEEGLGRGLRRYAEHG